MPGTETNGKAKPETVQEVAHHSPQSCMKRRFGSGNSDGPVCQDLLLIPVRSAILNCPALYSYSRVCKYSFVSSHTESVFAWVIALPGLWQTLAGPPPPLSAYTRPVSEGGCQIQLHSISHLSMAGTFSAQLRMSVAVLLWYQSTIQRRFWRVLPHLLFGHCKRWTF